MHTDELDQNIISSIITSIGSYHLSPGTTHKTAEKRWVALVKGGVL